MNTGTLSGMERKRRPKEELDADCEVAIRQIFEKGYDKAVPEGYKEQLI